MCFRTADLADNDSRRFQPHARAKALEHRNVRRRTQFDVIVHGALKLCCVLNRNHTITWRERSHGIETRIKKCCLPRAGRARNQNVSLQANGMPKDVGVAETVQPCSKSVVLPRLVEGISGCAQNPIALILRKGKDPFGASPNSKIG